MRDQATRLREIKRADQKAVPAQKQEHTRLLAIAITSGKGGVGKTNVCLNLGIALAQTGKKVVVMDADLNLGNLDVLLGLSPRFTLRNVISGQKQIEEILTDGPEGIKILPASSGALEMADINSEMRQRVIHELTRLNQSFDFLLIDTPAGIGHHVFDFINFSHRTLVITTPEPTAIIDAYAVIKLVWHQNLQSSPVHLVVNHVHSAASAEEVFDKLNLVTQRFLNRKIEEWSYIQHDQEVAQAVHRQQPFVILFPESKATQSIYTLRDKILAGASAAIKTQKEFLPLY